MKHILLQNILGLSEDDFDNCKVELSISEGQGGKSQLNNWLALDEKSKENGKNKLSYWSYQGKSANFYKDQLVFSFVRIDGDDWLLISAAKILKVVKDNFAEVEILDKYKPFFGRLIIRCKKGNTYSRYSFKLRTIIGYNCCVKEILASLYGGKEFEGYDKVRLSYEELNRIVSGIAPKSWTTALENQKAVYLITDMKDGNQYVGSAYGENGMLLQRWSNYIANGHGGNKKLKELLDRKGFDYIKENFQYSVLENFNARIDKNIIISRENWWKETLGSRAFGLNSN